MTMANVTAYPGYISTTAPTAFEAFSALLDAMAEAPGDYEIVGPYGVGILGGAIVTGSGYTATFARGDA
jgi:hypothetical protein